MSSLAAAACLSGEVPAALMMNANFDASNLQDISGHYNDLTLTPADAAKTYNGGGVTYSANDTGKNLAAPWNQTIYLNMADTVKLNNFTVSLWADITTTAWDNFFDILGSTDTTLNDGNVGIRFQTRGNSTAYTAYSSISGASHLNGTDSPGTGYRNVILTSNGGNVTMYVDGTAVGTAAWTTTQQMGIIAFAGSAFQGSGDGRNLAGKYDNLAIYDRGLSQTEVSAIYNAGSSATTAFGDIYSTELSGTANVLSTLKTSAVWSHRFGSGAVDATGQTVGTYDQIELSAAASGSVTLDADVLTNPISFGSNGVSLNVENGKSITVASLVGDMYGFTKTGAGTLVLSGTRNFDTHNYSGNNDNFQAIVIEGGILDVTGSAKLFTDGYRGKATITAKTGGTLRIGNFAGYGGSTGSLRSEANARILDGGKFDVVGGTQSGGNLFQVTTNGGTLNFNIPTGQTAATLTFSDTSSRTMEWFGTLTVTGNGNIVVGQAITSSTSTNGSIVMNGTGTLTFTGSKATGFSTGSDTGKNHNVTINSGTLKVTNGAKLYNTHQGTSIVQINNGGTLEVDNFVSYGSGSLGALRANDGSVLLNGGTVRVVGATQSGEIGFNVIGANSQLLVTNADAAVTFENKNGRIINVNAAGFKIGGEGDIEIARSLKGSAGFTKVGSGTLKLSNTTNFDTTSSRQIIVEEGVLEITGGARLVTAYNSATYLTVKKDGTLRVGNFSAYGTSTGAIRSERQNRILDGGKVEVVAGGKGSNTFTVTANGGEFCVVNAGTTETFDIFKNDGASEGVDNCCTLLNGNLTVSGAGTLILNGKIVGTGGIVKNGAGTLVIASKGNTFTGANTFNAGNVLVNGKIVGESTVNGGLLGGTGTLADTTVAAGGTLTAALAGTIGTITIGGDLEILEGGKLLVDVASKDSADLFIVEGNLALEKGSIHIDAADLWGLNNQTVDFLQLTADSKVTLPDDISTALDDASFGSFELLYNPNTMVLSIASTYVPEPASWVLLVLGTLGVVGMRRRHLSESK